MKITPIKQINSFREWIAWKLVDLAKWINPDNENAKSFLMEKLIEVELEAMKYGKYVLEFKVKKSK